MAPSILAYGLQSLPPILHMTVPNPMPGYSKAPRGLFVLPRVARVFTGTAISPSPPSRQWPSRSTIHAGRNLPDKGLRYLRHVVTLSLSLTLILSQMGRGETRTVAKGAGHFCRPLHVAMQIGPYLPARSVSGSGVWSLRIPEGIANLSVHPVPLVFPADYPHRTHCHPPLMMSGLVAPDTRTFQHIARFYNGLRQWR